MPRAEAEARRGFDPDAVRNVYEVTEEFYSHNGKYGTREDVVFLVNGIPVAVIECKNASKDEAIALGVDQIRRYHEETPEVMVPEMLFTATEAIGFAYGVTWNTVRRNIFRWKHEEIGNLEELNKILERAVNLKNFLKGKDRVPKVAHVVADHFRLNVEPLGYKAFLVAVDREACVFYKEHSLAVRPMRNKWASCSTAGNLNFNAELLALDREIGDYVIVHEMLHFFVPNHGKLWKSLMRAHLGNFEAIAERLPRTHISARRLGLE